MWQCPKCGEAIEGRFDSCWKCAGLTLPPNPTHAGASKSNRGLFFIYWRRGWLVLLMNFCLGLCFAGVGALLSALERQGGGTASLVILALLILLVPALAYWLFVLFFGEETWPLPAAGAGRSREEEAFALLQEATRLEARGLAREALAKYQQVAERYPGTEAGQDAQKSLESLRAKIG